MPRAASTVSPQIRASPPRSRFRCFGTMRSPARSLSPSSPPRSRSTRRSGSSCPSSRPAPPRSPKTSKPGRTIASGDSGFLAQAGDHRLAQHIVAAGVGIGRQPLQLSFLLALAVALPGFQHFLVLDRLRLDELPRDRATLPPVADRKRVVKGKSVSERVDLVGRRINQNKQQ